MHHVVPNSDRVGWNVKRGDTSKTSKHFDTKTDCGKVGRAIRRNPGTEFIVHGKDRRIQ